jgi:hypothetical protein
MEGTQRNVGRGILVGKWRVLGFLKLARPFCLGKLDRVFDQLLKTWGEFCDHLDSVITENFLVVDFDDSVVSVFLSGANVEADGVKLDVGAHCETDVTRLDQRIPQEGVFRHRREQPS